jgi:hypothetical protein
MISPRSRICWRHEPAASEPTRGLTSPILPRDDRVVHGARGVDTVFGGLGKDEIRLDEVFGRSSEGEVRLGVLIRRARTRRRTIAMRLTRFQGTSRHETPRPCVWYCVHRKHNNGMLRSSLGTLRLS